MDDWLSRLMNRPFVCVLISFDFFCIHVYCFREDVEENFGEIDVDTQIVRIYFELILVGVGLNLGSVIKFFVKKVEQEIFLDFFCLKRIIEADDLFPFL